jgi:hypothetical protein
MAQTRPIAAFSLQKKPVGGAFRSRTRKKPGTKAGLESLGEDA